MNFAEQYITRSTVVFCVGYFHALFVNLIIKIYNNKI